MPSKEDLGAIYYLLEKLVDVLDDDDTELAKSLLKKLGPFKPETWKYDIPEL